MTPTLEVGVRKSRPLPFVEQALAASLVVAWAAAIPLVQGLTTASVAVIAAAPMWITAYRWFRWGKALLVVSILALVNGWVLNAVLSGSRPFDTEIAITLTLRLIAGLGGMGMLLWARRYLQVPTIAGLAGITFLFVHVGDFASSANAWKFYISAPLTVVVLSLLDRQPVLTQGLALVTLAGIGLTQDSRSYVGICVLTLVFLLLQWRRRSWTVGWRTYVFGVIVGAGVIYGLYLMATAAILDGYLGEATQQRSQVQIERAGSLLSGGRPEWHATIELMQVQPMGFGLGAVPTYHDVWTAREGLVTVGTGLENRYVDFYMFDGTFNLHSVTADFWVHCGVFGLLLALLCLVILIQGLTDGIMALTLPAVVAFLACKALWDLAFSPMYSSLPWLTLAIALLLRAKSGLPEDAEARLPSSAARMDTPTHAAQGAPA